MARADATIDVTADAAQLRQAADEAQRVSADGREVRLQASELRIEHRAEGDGPGTFVGYAAVFNELSLPLGMFMPFRERIAPGAFTDAIDGDPDTRFLLGHDDYPLSTLGRTGPGTLRLSQDALGLRVENDLPDTQAARDLVTAVERHDVDQMSFGFSDITDEWEDPPDTVDPEALAARGTDLPIRTLLRIGKLYDVSPVTFPAYPQTSGTVRAHLRQLDERRSTEARAQLVEAERRWLRLAHPLAFPDAD